LARHEVGVDFIDKVDKANRVVVLIGQGDIKIGRIHDASERAVDGADELADVGAAHRQLANFQQHRLHRFQPLEAVFHNFPK
jgi:hypothetical protein